MGATEEEKKNRKPFFKSHFHFVKQKFDRIFHFLLTFLFFRLVIQPLIKNGTSQGEVTIDVVNDANVQGIQPIILDINNITILEAQGKCTNEIIK